MNGIGKRKLVYPLLLTVAWLLSATAAQAHTGVGATTGFTHGFLHPVSGLDHVLVMVAVGLFAVHLGGRALWLVPLSFVSMMVVGGIVGMAGFGLPFVEIGIALSVIVLGAAVAFSLHLPTVAAMGLVGLFAISHGHAHGMEMPRIRVGYDLRGRLCDCDGAAARPRHRHRPFAGQVGRNPRDQGFADCRRGNGASRYRHYGRDYLIFYHLLQLGSPRFLFRIGRVAGD